MHGRVCVVTGASSGIGRAVTEALVQQGATVAMVCRDRSRGEAARASVRRATGVEAVDLVLADLCCQASVRQLAAELLHRYPRIHVLVNNAGILNFRYATTDEGIEAVFAVNHLSHFLLTRLLLERLRASAPARIVNVTSIGHRLCRVRSQRVGQQGWYWGLTSYTHSKLANVLFTYELARRESSSGVTANCVHPGVTATNLANNNGRVFRWLLDRFLRPWSRTSAQGAATPVFLASAPSLEGVSGQYFVDSRAVRSSRRSYHLSLARQLWDVSSRLTGMDP